MNLSKTKTIRKIILIFTVFMISFILSSGASAYVLKQWHIANGTTRVYYVGSDISSDGVYSITVADNQWNGISNRHVYLSQASTTTTVKTWTQNNNSEIFKNDMGANAGYLARSRALSFTDQTYTIVTETDTCLNTYYSLSNTVPPGTGSYCVKTLVAHEFGHWIGLAESDQTSIYDAIMTQGQPIGVSSYNLKTDDLNGYSAISW